MLANSATIIGRCPLLDEDQRGSHHPGLRPIREARGHKREKSTNDGRYFVDVKKFKYDVLYLEESFAGECKRVDSSERSTIRYIEVEEFQPQDLHPVSQLDESWLCQLSTTFAVVTSSPHQLGNDILSFLRSAADSSVTLRRTKGTIKATLVQDFTLVSLKFRLLVLVSGSVAVQVQRRAGDSVVFSQVFASFTHYLRVLQYEFHFPALCDESLFPFVLFSF